MKPSRITLSLMLALGTQPVLAADLMDTYRAAQSQDAVFGAARAAHEAGQEKLTQGRALLLPSVTLSADRTRYDTHVESSALPAPVDNQYSSHGYAVTLVQPLFREQNWALYVESDLQVMQSEAQYRAAEQDLVLRTAQAYFNVLAAQDSVQLAAAQKTAIAQQLEQAKRNFEVGTATITDTHEAQARYDLIVAQEIAAQSQLEVAIRTLQQLTGVVPGPLAVLGGNLGLEPPQPAGAEAWVKEAEQGNPQLAIARAADALADKEVDRNRGGHLPTVDLVANYSKSHSGYNSSLGGPADSRVTSVGVQLNLPLFQGGATQSRWREAAANRERARQELENARRNVEVQTRQAYLGVVNGIARVQALQQALKSSESLLEASKLGHEVGVRTNLDVLNAQQQAYSTRRDLYLAGYDYLMSRLRLKAATGSLSEEELKKVNQALK